MSLQLYNTMYVHNIKKMNLYKSICFAFLLYGGWEALHVYL
jgi:hypothetical protein